MIRRATGLLLLFYAASVGGLRAQTSSTLVPTGSELRLTLVSGETIRGRALEPVTTSVVLDPRGDILPSLTYELTDLSALQVRSGNRILEGVGIGLGLGFVAGILWNRSACDPVPPGCTSSSEASGRRNALTAIGEILGLLAGVSYPTWTEVEIGR